MAEDEEVTGGTWRAVVRHGGVYTGGKVEASRDGRFFACLLEENVAIVDMATGRLLFTLRRRLGVADVDADEDAAHVSVGAERFTTFCLHPDGHEMVTASENQLLRRWDLGAALTAATGAGTGTGTGTGIGAAAEAVGGVAAPTLPGMVRAWKGHTSPVTCADFHGQGDLFATGASDRTVKVWSMSGAYCTHNFRAHASVLTHVSFHPRADVMELMSGDAAGAVHVWNLLLQTDGSSGNSSGNGSGEGEGRAHAALTNHVSAVTAVCASVDDADELVFTASRDKVVNVWRRGQLINTFAALEAVEGMVAVPRALVRREGEAELPKHSHVVAIAGNLGVVRLLCFTLDPKMKKHNMCCLRAQDKHHGSGGALVGLALRRAQQPRPQGAEGAEGADISNVQATAQGTGTGMGTGTGTAALMAMSFDHLILFVDPATLAREKQVVGYHDEILDLECVPGSRKVVMATNAAHATLLDLDSFDSQLLEGHAAMILNVAVSPDGRFAATASKDSTVRVFTLAGKKPRCVAVGRGHTEAVSAVAFVHYAPEDVLPLLDPETAPQQQQQQQQQRKRQRTGGSGGRGGGPAVPALLCTVGADKSIKLWAVAGGPGQDSGEDGQAVLRCVHTEMAHDKSVNALARSPNGGLLASGSQDRTVKLWAPAPRHHHVHNDGDGDGDGDGSGSGRGSGKAAPAALALRGVLRGHKRGVWHVQFSPVDRCLASASADKAVRVWSVADMSCLAVLQGHETSVLRVQYLPSGREIVSAGSTGLIKVWSLKTGQCVGTMEEHMDKVWALALSHPKVSSSSEEASSAEAEEPFLLSGGADSALVEWRDFARELAATKAAAEEAVLMQEQELFASLRRGDFTRAALRALELNRPFQLRSAVEAIVAAPDGEHSVDGLVAALDAEQRLKCWGLVREWNMFARNSAVAHELLQALLKVDVPLRGEGSGSGSGCGRQAHALLDPLLAYSERHFQRIDRLLKDSFLIDHALACMGDLPAA